MTIVTYLLLFNNDQGFSIVILHFNLRKKQKKQNKDKPKKRKQSLVCINCKHTASSASSQHSTERLLLKMAFWQEYVTLKRCYQRFFLLQTFWIQRELHASLLCENTLKNFAAAAFLGLVWICGGYCLLKPANIGTFTFQYLLCFVFQIYGICTNYG